MISMREAYEKIGANYEDACARLMGEEMLSRFALKFLDDESMDKLEAAMAAGDAEGARQRGDADHRQRARALRGGRRGVRSARLRADDTHRLPLL